MTQHLKLLRAGFLVKLIITIFAGVFVGSGLSIYTYFYSQLPELKAALDYKPALITSVYDRNGELIAEYAIERRIIIPLNQIPNIMQKAIISVEDSNFFQHSGLDLPGIARAALSNLQAGEIVQGGSTITQQLAKSLFLSHERTVSRKIKEALLSIQLEKALTKNRILELYLNQVYFGSGAYGIEAASRTYFSKSCADLSLNEAALLAGLPKAPSRFSPLRNPELALSRRNLVINRMVENGYLSSKEAEDQIKQPLGLAPSKNTRNKAPFFSEVLRRTLETEYGSKALYTEGFKIYTPLDLNYQQYAENAVDWGLREIDKRKKWRGPIPGLALAETYPDVNAPAGAIIESVGKTTLTINLAGILYTMDFKNIWIKDNEIIKLKPGDRIWFIVDEYIMEDNSIKGIKAGHITQEPVVEGALLSLDPRNGDVLAWVGGYSFGRSQFDRVTQSQRQPGSAFKPFIYAAALDEQYTPADVIYDTPFMTDITGRSIDQILSEQMNVDEGTEEVDENEPEPVFWKPHNFSEVFGGAITLRRALAKSMNIITIRLLQEVGIESTIRLARQLDIKSPLQKGLPLALGSSEVNLYEMTNAYCAFANQGVLSQPVMVHKITDRNDRTIREYYPVLRRALRTDTAFLISYLLQGVVQHGTAFAARSLNRPIGGKTGTTNDFHDAWFIGFTPQVVTGVWTGMDIQEPIGRRATGAAAALPIWLKFMEKILGDYPVEEFPVPVGIVFRQVCSETGLLKTPSCTKSVNEAFREGTEPVRYCDKCASSSQKTTPPDFDLDWDR